MQLRDKVKILVVLLSLLVLGLMTTLATDLFAKSTTSPSNITYSSDDVEYFHAPLLPITQLKKRGFPFISSTKVVTKYTDEGVIKTAFSGTSTWVQLPAISSTGSNSFTRIFLTWQFYADILTWTIVWLLLGYLIKSIKHKDSRGIKIAAEKTDLKRGVDYIGISASFIIHDGKGNILLQKRGTKARDENGRWDVGGGAIEFGESIQNAVKREIHEELGVDALDIKFLTTYDAFRKHNRNKTHWIAIMHAVKVDPKKIKIGEPEKIEEIGWFTSNNLPKPLHSQFWKSYQIALDMGVVK